MRIKDVASKKKTLTTEFPDMPGFMVDISYLGRDELTKLRDKCKTLKINKRTRDPEEVIDNDLFSDLYVDAVITGWTGFKQKYLMQLVVMEEYDESKAEEDVEFDSENARSLMSASTIFDRWVTELLNDVENFNKDS